MSFEEEIAGSCALWAAVHQPWDPVMGPKDRLETFKVSLILKISNCTEKTVRHLSIW